LGARLQGHGLDLEAILLEELLVEAHPDGQRLGADEGVRDLDLAHLLRQASAASGPLRAAPGTRGRAPAAARGQQQRHQSEGYTDPGGCRPMAAASWRTNSVHRSSVRTPDSCWCQLMALRE